jgi:hypothetical protein
VLEGETQQSLSLYGHQSVCHLFAMSVNGAVHPPLCGCAEWTAIHLVLDQSLDAVLVDQCLEVQDTLHPQA